MLRRHAELLVVAVLLALHAGLLVHTALDKSETFDEPDYLRSSEDLVEGGWKYGTPAVPRYLVGVAMRVVAPEVHQPGPRASSHEFWSALSFRSQRNILLAGRMVSILFSLVGAFALWRIGRRWGPFVGVTALALWATAPVMLASACLVVPHGWAASTIALLTLAVVRARERPSTGRLAVVGAALGLALGTFTAATLAVPTLGLLLCAHVHEHHESLRARARALVGNGALIFGIAALTLWAIYGFSFGPVFEFGPPETATWWSTPAPAWVSLFLEHRQRYGTVAIYSQNYALGTTYEGSVWWFYPLTFLVKLPVAVQALVVLRLATLVRSTRRELALDAALLLFPALLFVALSRSPEQPNIQYLLVGAAPVIAWLALVGDRLGRLIPGPGRVRAVLAGLLALGSVEMLRVHPHHLMFFNVWAGGPAEGPNILMNREDWGQDKKRLADWIAAHPGGPLYYYSLTESYARWGLVEAPYPCRPTPGTYAVHAKLLFFPGPWMLRVMKPTCLNWLVQEPPDERLGWSIYVWRVDEARAQRLAQGVEGRWRHVPDL